MPTAEHTATEKRDVYERVTSQIINAIEQGVRNWRMPWHTSGKFAFSPINVTSKKPYRGINTLCLWAAAQAKGYERGEWATYNQWQERSAQVRKGEKATTVVFWKFAMDGYTPKADAETSMEQRIESAEQFFSRINARVVHQGNRAFYSPDTDAITLPPFGAFFTPLDYYGTRAHETGHWTSREGRCNRELGKRFGDNAYSVEELVAELTAAFTLAHLGLSTEPRPDHAQYIQSWLRKWSARHSLINPPERIM
jgi:antirestriction protein ArdC